MIESAQRKALWKNAAWAITIFISLVLFSPWRGPGIKRWDCNEYFYAGWLLTQGKVLFRDIWVHKGVLNYPTGALYVITGLSEYDIPYFDLIAVTASILLLQWLGYRLYGNSASIFSIALYCIFIFRNDSFFNAPYLPEVYAIPFVLASIVLIIKNDPLEKFEDHVINRIHIFLMGLFGAISCLYRESSIANLLPWHFYFLIAGFRKRSRLPGKWFITYATGWLMPPAVLLFYVFRHGLWNDYVDVFCGSREIVLSINEIKIAKWFSEMISSINILYFFGKIWLFLIWIFIAICSSSFANRSVRRYLFLISSSFALEIFTIYLAKVVLLHYLTQIAWSLSLLLTAPFGFLLRYARARQNPLTRRGMRIAIIGSLTAIILAIARNSPSPYPDIPIYRESVNLYAKTLEKVSQPSSKVQNMGASDTLQILLQARRLPANRFIYLYEWLLSDVTERMRRRKSEFLSMINDEKPDFVVWGIGEPFCPYSRNLVNFDLFDRLRRFILEYYEPVDTPGLPPRIFRRKKTTQ